MLKNLQISFNNNILKDFPLRDTLYMEHIQVYLLISNIEKYCHFLNLTESLRFEKNLF